MPANQIQAAKKKAKLNKTSVTLQPGKTVKLKVRYNKKKVKWSTSNKKVAKVSKKGKVTAVAAGTAKITAKVAKKSYQCKIQVKESSTSKVTPTTAPLPGKVQGNFTKLKNYIVANGMLGDAGNKEIRGNCGDTLSVSISYDARNKAYIFDSYFSFASMDGVKISSRTKMVISEHNLRHAAMENTNYVGTYDAVLKGEASAAAVNGENGPTWTLMIANPSDGSVKWVDFAKNRWGSAYAGWRLLLLETLAFDMDDLGFRKR